jgi:endo-1,4-beta-mannosidase
MPKRKKNGDAKSAAPPSKKRSSAAESWVPPVAEMPEAALTASPAEAAPVHAPAEPAPASAPAAPALAPAPASSAAAVASTAERMAPGRRNPAFALGATLYPLDSESQSPADWYARDQAEDLSAMSAAGFSLSRVFVSWKSIEPQVGQYDVHALVRLTDLVAAARKHHLKTIVCLFADDRQAELIDLPWARRRDPRTDSYLLQRETELIAQVVAVLQGEMGVFGWQLANEAFCSGFTTATDLEAWTRLMREAIRELDPARPITLGVDAETFFRSTGIDARPAIATCEFAVSHVTSAYRAYAAEGPSTSGPSTYLDAFLLRLAERGLPVLADEVGALSLDGSPAEEAAALRTSLWSGLANRASGLLLRRFRDFATEHREPYFLDPFETLVGVVDGSGGRKPAFEEARRFLLTLGTTTLRGLEPTPERTAIVVPAERYQPLPNLAGLFDPRACLSAFIGAKEAHIPVTLAQETDDFGCYSVLVVPSAFRLGKKTWNRLAAFVQGGGSLVLSYGGGDAPSAIRELFGVEPLGDAGARQRLSCRVAQDGVLGELADFDVRFAVPNFALLTADSATVVATDSDGSPLLTVNQYGQGRAIYLAVPLERAIAQGDPWATPAPVRNLLREVYGAVALAAGCGAPVSCSAPDVELTLFQGDAEDLLVLINHSPAAVKPELVTTRRVESVVDLHGGSPISVNGMVFQVRLGPNGAVALRLAYS